MNSKILVTQSSMPSKEEYWKEIEGLWDSHWLTNMGEKHDLLTAQLEHFLDVQNLALFNNGHMALELAIQAMDLHGEVITTPFTFASTTQAIVRNGLTPVFCDIDPVNYTIDASKIEFLITEKTSAIIPVHVYGNICAVDKISEIAEKYHLKVIYDAAHAFGVTYRGRGIGSYGDASMFSFHATKVFHTIEGGAVSYRDKEYGGRLTRLRNFGIQDEGTVSELGANGKMNEFQAAMGLCNLRHIKEEIQKRKKSVEGYREMLVDVPGLQLPVLQADVETNYAYFPIVIDPQIFGASRDEVCEALKKQNIFARKYFYPLTSSFSCYQGKYKDANVPIAKYISENVLTLPLYAELSMAQVKRICECILKTKD